MTTLKLVTAAETYPVTRAEAKAHLRVDSDDEDALIDRLIAAATAHAERFTGLAFIDQTWDLYLDAYPEDGKSIAIPMAPLLSIESVASRAGDGSYTAIDAAAYLTDAAAVPPRVGLPSSGSWPTPASVASAVRVRFRAGYVNADVSPVTGAVPEDIKAAILMIIGTLYAQRETVVVGASVNMMPWAAEQLLRPYRIHTAIG